MTLDIICTAFYFTIYFMIIFRFSYSRKRVPFVQSLPLPLPLHQETFIFVSYCLYNKKKFFLILLLFFLYFFFSYLLYLFCLLFVYYIPLLAFSYATMIIKITSLFEKCKFLFWSIYTMFLSYTNTPLQIVLYE